MGLTKYKNPIEKCFDIVNKKGERVNFILNNVQSDFLQKATGRDVILKSRQLGFSSLLLAIFTLDFIKKENSRSVVVAHDTEITQKLFDRVKFYIKSFEEKVLEGKTKIPLKYNSRNEMVNEFANSSFYIGTAGARDFGRGDTLSNLLLSEMAFYSNPEKLLSGALQAVVPNGKIFIETTANGFNFFKTFWDECRRGERPFKPHFYDPLWEYDQAFLDQKKKELKELFLQEYPFTQETAFIASGQPYFDRQALKFYSENTREPIEVKSQYV